MARWGNLFHWLRRDEELDDEIAFHIEELTHANITQGMSPTEARRHAMIAFGGRDQAKQKLREVHSSAFLDSLSFNLRAAIRFIRRRSSSSPSCPARRRAASRLADTILRSGARSCPRRSPGWLRW